MKRSVWLSLGSNQYQAGRVYDLCVYFMTVAPKGSPKVVLYGEAGNQTCDPWFTRHRLIPYTTVTSLRLNYEMDWMQIRN